ncbi:helix-turn-helix transcriptional regulator [Streptomyces sp. NPDC048193]|uniref:helix-turn-helix domain-containing protein n=1 Tax=Streptomyces sp. NPDC048193 TaxID=3155630 RepID=UPI003438687B
MSAGQKLRRFRERQGMSIRIAAEELDTSHVVIWRWETGACTPSVPSLIKIAAFMGCTIDELLKREVTE